MGFILIIAGLLGLSFFFLVVTGTFIGDAIKEANMTEEEKKQKMYTDYLDLFNEFGWSDMEGVKRTDAKSEKEMRWCGIWDKYVKVAEAIEAEDKLIEEERQLELEERKLMLAERKQRVKQAQVKR